MTYAAKSILWILTGPVASLILGYGAFLFLGFILGPGFDIDDIGTPTQKFFGKLTLPVSGAIVIGGALVSLVVGIRYCLAHRAMMADSCPPRVEALPVQATKTPGRTSRGT